MTQLNSDLQNKLIIKNTVFLYLRMFIAMAVSLYISRIILRILGAEGFGIYNVTAGLVLTISFIYHSLVSSAQRFLAVTIEKNDKDEQQKIFNTLLTIQFMAVLAVAVIAETFGMWILSSKMKIPEYAFNSALWTFRLAVMTIIIRILSIPFISLIISHEKINVFSLINMIENILLLLSVLIIEFIRFDKIILYAAAVLIVTLIARLFQVIYCFRSFRINRIKFIWDKVLLNRLVKFTGWNLWGNAAETAVGHGTSVLLSLFFSPVVIAARSISYQVRTALYQFPLNFQTALSPRIYKSYSNHEVDYMHKLVLKGAKYSYYLMLFFSLPVLLETEYILNLWLTALPEYTVIFTKLIIISLLIDGLSGTLLSAAQASGSIKNYQIVIGLLLLAYLPVSYLFLSWNYSPVIVYVISILLGTAAFAVRLFFLKGLIKLEITVFVKQVLMKIFYVTALSLPLPILILVEFEPSLLRVLLVSFASVLSCMIAIYFAGSEDDEKVYLHKIKNSAFIKLSYMFSK